MRSRPIGPEPPPFLRSLRISVLPGEKATESTTVLVRSRELTTVSGLMWLP